MHTSMGASTFTVVIVLLRDVDESHISSAEQSPRIRVHRAQDHDTHRRRRLRSATIASYTARTPTWLTHSYISHALTHCLRASLHRVAARGKKKKKHAGMLRSPVGHDLLHRWCLRCGQTRYVARAQSYILQPRRLVINTSHKKTGINHLDALQNYNILPPLFILVSGIKFLIKTWISGFTSNDKTCCDLKATTAVDTLSDVGGDY